MPSRRRTVSRGAGAGPIETRARGSRLRLLLDEQFTAEIADQLSAQSYDGAAVSGGVALEGLDDEALLRIYTDQGRALVTSK